MKLGRNESCDGGRTALGVTGMDSDILRGVGSVVRGDFWDESGRFARIGVIAELLQCFGRSKSSILAPPTGFLCGVVCFDLTGLDEIGGRG
jgi:hypothetical protein